MSSPTYGAVSRRLIALNGSAGAFVDIYCISFCRQIEQIEDEAAATQGIQEYDLIDNFNALQTYNFDEQPIDLPNVHRMGQGGALIGFPAQGISSAFNYIPAPRVVSARSKSVTATTLRFIENA